MNLFDKLKNLFKIAEADIPFFHAEKCKKNNNRSDLKLSAIF